MAGGRPTIYANKIADEICERLSEGESLNKICHDDHIPDKATVYRWLSDPERREFCDKYTRARERQAETFIDECVDIADMTEMDTIRKTTKNGDEYDAPDHEWITRSRLRVETRIKIAEKLAPKKYTPKNEISGPEGKPLFGDIKNLTKEEMIQAYQDAVKS